MEDKTAFFAVLCVVCEALYTFFWPSISVYAHKQLKNLLRLVQYLKTFCQKIRSIWLYGWSRRNLHLWGKKIELSLDYCMSQKTKQLYSAKLCL